MLRPLDVIWIHDECIRPPGPKMVVSVHPEYGYFFRINTEPKWQSPILITKNNNPWLDHDSYIECGQPLMLDDFVVDTSLRDRGVIGRLDAAMVGNILSAMAKNETVSEEDFEAIKLVLKASAGN